MNEQETLYELVAEIRDILKSLELAFTFGTIPITPDKWVQKTSGADVTVNPGELKTVLVVNDSGYLWEIGVNDETYTTYYLYVDGTQVGDPQYEPWGLYNSPYRFPVPIEFNSKIEVKVERHSDAPAPADYYAKVRYIKK